MLVISILEIAVVTYLIHPHRGRYKRRQGLPQYQVASGNPRAGRQCWKGYSESFGEEMRKNGKVQRPLRGWHARHLAPRQMFWKNGKVPKTLSRLPEAHAAHGAERTCAQTGEGEERREPFRMEGKGKKEET